MRRVELVLSALLSAGPVAAQTSIPIRQVTAPVGTDSGAFKVITNIRPLPRGRVLMNDFLNRLVVMLDSNMKVASIVLDSNSTAANRYGSAAGVLIRYIGDSSAFLDQVSKSFVVIDGSGRPVRTMAMPRSSDMMTLLGPAYNPTHAFDNQGRLIFRVLRSTPATPRPEPLLDSGVVTRSFQRDSVAVIRIDPDSKVVDTMGIVANAVSKRIRMSTGSGSIGGNAINPAPVTDDWTFLVDGSIAIVRGHDYHIDWVSPNLKVTSTPKMDFAWRRITDDEKIKLTDSLKIVAIERASGPPLTSSFGGVTRTTPRPPAVYFEPNELPDYYPPIRIGQVKSDPDGNVWILPTTSVVTGGGLVYDLVNRKGEVFERVQLPEGRNLVAVGPNGSLYLSYTPKGGLIRLERVTVIRPRTREQ